MRRHERSRRDRFEGMAVSAKLARRLTNMTSCLIGMGACAGAHHVGRQLDALGHDVRLIPAKYVRPFLKGHKNDYRDAEAIAEAVQRPTMRFVALKSTAELSPLLLRLLEDLIDDWRQLDGRIEDLTTQIETLANEDENCRRLWECLGSDR